MKEVAKLTCATPKLGIYWNSINWKAVNIEVKQLQMRIAKAVEEKKWNKVKSLQWILSHSFSAKLLAVKRVTSRKGAKTAGTDGVVWKIVLWVTKIPSQRICKLYCSLWYEVCGFSFAVPDSGSPCCWNEKI